tara:strand:- start:78 stop:458 length:381 start_codon:yes stop_codon:yes gene_type:complete
MNKFKVRIDLPKLYRVVYAHVEWLTNTCVNGEHEQDCGTDYVRVMRVIGHDNSWKWVIIDKWYDLDIYQREWIGDCSEFGGCQLEWSEKDPHLYRVQQALKSERLLFASLHPKSIADKIDDIETMR